MLTTLLQQQSVNATITFDLLGSGLQFFPAAVITDGANVVDTHDGGYEVVQAPSERKKAKKAKKRASVTPDLVAAAAAAAPPTEKVTEPQIDSSKLEELQLSVSELSLKAELEALTLEKARQEEEARLAKVAEELRVLQERHAFELEAKLAEEEMLAAAERSELIDILDLLDSDLWAALAVHEGVPSKQATT